MGSRRVLKYRCDGPACEFQTDRVGGLVAHKRECPLLYAPGDVVAIRELLDLDEGRVAGLDGSEVPAGDLDAWADAAGFEYLPSV